MPLFNNWFKGGGKESLRKYYIIAGTYLLVVVVVFSVLVLRWGTTPSPDLPGFEGTGQQNSGEQHPAVELQADGEGKDSESEKLGQTGAQYAEPGNDVMASPGDQTTGSGARSEETTDHIDDPGEKQEELTELPAAAKPLPHWEVALPFGNYLSNSIPSGGVVHSLSRGVLLRTTPSAPVSALWDGVVTQVSVMNGLYRCSVLIEHANHIGEYSTFYGNMREIWVKEGALVSRGENIGLMAYSVGREEQPKHEGSLPVSGKPSAVKGQSLEIRTVWSGYIEDFPLVGTKKAPSFTEESVPTLLPVREAEGFPLNNPLLYLEIREGGNFLDPLIFITARN